MKLGKRPVTVVSVVFAGLLSLSIVGLDAHDADRNTTGDMASRTFAAAQTARRQCVNACRARYRDCRRLGQLPSFECQSVYQDCTRYACTGAGPG